MSTVETKCAPCRPKAERHPILLAKAVGAAKHSRKPYLLHMWSTHTLVIAVVVNGREGPSTTAQQPRGAGPASGLHLDGPGSPRRKREESQHVTGLIGLQRLHHRGKSDGHPQLFYAVRQALGGQSPPHDQDSSA